MSAKARALAGQRIVVTGAGGFVGRRVCGCLAAGGAAVTAVVREARAAPPGTRAWPAADIAAPVDWGAALDGADAVVHLAAVTHGADLDDTAARERYDAVNVIASRTLAAAAAVQGVSTLVFMSSIKVNGERTRFAPGDVQRFGPDDPPLPEDNYGRSKWAAEQALGEVAEQGGMRLVILRPPLVYGPGMKGNLARLLRWVAEGRPLPLAGIENARSLVGVDNLADAVVQGLAAEHAKGVYTLADVEWSTPELVAALAEALGVRARLFRVPLFMMRFAAAMTGRAALVSRLTGSLLVDTARAERELGWRPRRRPADMLAEAARLWRSGA